MITEPGLREDFARATIHYVDDEGSPLIAEVTTSWSFVGAGLRLSSELLGPEYSLWINSLDTSLKLFLKPAASRARPAKTWLKNRMLSRA